MSIPFPTTIGGKIEMAASYKVKGNEFFTNEKYKKAIIEYSKAISFTRGLPGRKQGLEGVSKVASDSTGSNEDKISSEQESAVIDLEVTIKTNITTCYLKLNNGTKALETIREALVLRPEAWKSLMRQSEAYLMLGLTDKAMNSIDLALNSNTNAVGNQVIDGNIEMNLLKVKEKIKKQMKIEDLRQRKSFGKIFDKANHASSPHTINTDSSIPMTVQSGVNDSSEYVGDDANVESTST